MSKYSVIAGNIGTVIETDDIEQAMEEFSFYANNSEENIGRVAGETVTLIEETKNGLDIVKEYMGTLDKVEYSD